MISSKIRSSVFCDWLTVTCSPIKEETFIPALVGFMVTHCVPISFRDDRCTLYRVGDGVIKLECQKAFHSSSATGAALTWLRKNELFYDYINVLGDVPHKVTRLDASVDVYLDAPLILRQLESEYPDDIFNFGRKALRVSRLYSARLSDGQLTGTWYVGHRTNARVSARVYDKQEEAFVKRGEVLPPTTRFELTFRKDFNCSLYDAIMPETLFYAHASPKLIDLPDHDVLPWANEGSNPWLSLPQNKKDYSLTIEAFDKRVANSPDLLYLAELALQFGPAGEAVLMRHLKNILGSREGNCFSRTKLPSVTGTEDSGRAPS